MADQNTLNIAAAPETAFQSNSASAPAVVVRDIAKRYVLQGGGPPKLFRRQNAGDEFWALKGVTFTIDRGERVGIMGQNGAGKSTLLKVLSRIVAPTRGEAVIYGRVTSLLEVGTGFNPDLTGRQNIYLNASLHGLSREETEQRMEAITTFSEIGRFVDEPVRVYSTGMRARLAFSVSAHLEPDILMLDEVLSVGDASFQRKCLQRVEDLTGPGRTLLFVSHSSAAVRRFCDRCIWLHDGEIVMDGEASEVCDSYTEQMLSVSATYVANPTPQPHPQPAKAKKAAEREDQNALDEEPAAALVSARVLDEHGEPARSIKVEHACAVEVVFDILRDNAHVEPALHFRNERDELLFVVAFVSDADQTPIETVGRYKATLKVPGNLLNEGYHAVTVALVTADPLVRHVEERNIVSFTVYERIQDDPMQTARGRYGRTFPGGLRPRLPWSLEPVRRI